MSPKNALLLSAILMCLTSPTLCLGQDVVSRPSDEILGISKPVSTNSSIYYKNKLEFSLETAFLPITIPFVFDCFVGDQYNQTPLYYTLVPTVAS